MFSLCAACGKNRNEFAYCGMFKVLNLVELNIVVALYLRFLFIYKIIEQHKFYVDLSRDSFVINAWSSSTAICANCRSSELVLVIFVLIAINFMNYDYVY